MLDVLARDPDGNCYNVEIQVRKYSAWPKRGIFYLARTLGMQLKTGEDYQELRASIGLHLLDFDLPACLIRMMLSVTKRSCDLKCEMRRSQM